MIGGKKNFRSGRLIQKTREQKNGGGHGVKKGGIRVGGGGPTVGVGGNIYEGSKLIRWGECYKRVVSPQSSAQECKRMDKGGGRGKGLRLRTPEWFSVSGREIREDGY